MKVTSKLGWLWNIGNLKAQRLKNEDKLKNEDDLKKDDIKNEDNLKD